MFTKVFITVGTTKFDLLAETVTTESVIEALKKLGCQSITLQCGDSTIEPGDFDINGVKVNIYRYKDNIQEDIASADLVISHGGAGTCLEVLEANKPLLVVINEELMHNHQIELAEQLYIDGHLFYCTCDMLAQTLQDVNFTDRKPFPKSNPSHFAKYLDSVIEVRK